MLTTHYVKRRQANRSSTWGIQVMAPSTDLLRVHVWGGAVTGRRRALWEWVSTGKRIQGVELDRLFKRYPICEFQLDSDLQWRIERDTLAQTGLQATVSCACGDAFPINSYGAGFLDAKGRCFGCDAAGNDTNSA